MSTTSTPRPRGIPIGLVWLALIAASWGLVVAAWYLLPLVATTNGVGLLAVLGLAVLIARTP